MTKYLLAALAVLAVTAAMLAMHFRGSAAISAAGRVAAEQRADGLANDLKQSEAARAKEHAQAEHFQTLSGQYERDKTDAQAKADRTIADLRAGNLRLRDQWATQRLATEAAASASKPDAAANGCAGVAVDLFRAIDPVVERQDSQIRALQAILTAERQP